MMCIGISVWDYGCAARKVCRVNYVGFSLVWSNFFLGLGLGLDAINYVPCGLIWCITVYIGDQRSRMVG